MSDQQPYTPTTEDIRRSYVYAESSSFHAIKPGPNESPLYVECEPPVKVARKRDAKEYRASQDEFDRWLAAEIAAAEQRGRVRGLREAAVIIRDSKFANSVKPPSQKVQVIEADWLDALADRLEGDDE